MRTGELYFRQSRISTAIFQKTEIKLKHSKHTEIPNDDENKNKMKWNLTQGWICQPNAINGTTEEARRRVMCCRLNICAMHCTVWLVVYISSFVHKTGAQHKTPHHATFARQSQIPVHHLYSSVCLLVRWAQNQKSHHIKRCHNRQFDLISTNFGVSKPRVSITGVIAKCWMKSQKIH